MRNIRLFNVAPSMPESLRFLEELAHNLWWSWNFEAIELFRRIHPQLWKQARSNPLRFLNRIPQSRFEDLAKDEGFLGHLKSVRDMYQKEMSGEADMRGGDRTHPRHCVAYFSLEYGIHESVRMYSGGLGALAGDHLKAASDLGLPLVSVGLMYRQGYFAQYLNSDGWQQERYPENELNLFPVRKALDSENRQLMVEIPLPGAQTLRAVVWQLDVGRVPLFLLDTNIPENTPELRQVTSRLYGGDRELRLKQELLLGIGGFHAVVAMGYEAVSCHMNEGHAAFLSLARIPYLVKKYELDIDSALEIVERTNIFTTHTPVPAGNECFHVDLVRPYLDALQAETGLRTDTILSWGRAAIGGVQHELSMTILGLRTAHRSNGVSRLHGVVARRMWAHLWPGHPTDEVPISHITNGAHAPSWVSREIATLYDRYLGDEWRNNPTDPAMLDRIWEIPDEELWRTQEIGRARLIRITRELAEAQMGARNASRVEMAQIKSVLDYDALTIGFARRFATYKRADLILSDVERLEALLGNEERPIQLIFAGKAHPADDAGKALIQKLFQFSKRTGVRRHMVFLENYNIRIARYLVQGCDVWLNYPRRPQEASGTSGMKATLNGGIHVSILDGWWEEGYRADRGWAIGRGEDFDDPGYQDTIESQALYNVLENEIIPSFYDRSTGHFSDRWVKMMKASMRMALSHFTSHRMTSEYNQRFYRPAMNQFGSLIGDAARKARSLVEERTRLTQLWSQIKIDIPHAEQSSSILHVGDRVKVETRVHLGEIRPNEVSVQVYYGPVNPENMIMESCTEDMTLVENHGAGDYTYRHEIVCGTTGRYGFTSRIIPQGEDWKCVMPGFVTWADGA